MGMRVDNGHGASFRVMLAIVEQARALPPPVRPQLARISRTTPQPFARRRTFRACCDLACAFYQHRVPCADRMLSCSLAASLRHSVEMRKRAKNRIECRRERRKSLRKRKINVWVGLNLTVSCCATAYTCYMVFYIYALKVNAHLRLIVATHICIRLGAARRLGCLRAALRRTTENGRRHHGNATDFVWTARDGLPLR